MNADELRSHYRSYIGCLNERRFGDLAHYVAENVIYNRLRYTIDDYRNMLVEDTNSMPDLFFDIGILVVEDDHVAARLDFKCTPQREFLGFRPDGRAIRFSENVFYTFTQGKIIDVCSIIDRYAIEKQLGSANRISSFPIPATAATRSSTGDRSE